MPYGPGTYGSKKGRPPENKKGSPLQVEITKRIVTNKNPPTSRKPTYKA